MKPAFATLITVLVWTHLSGGQTINDPARIEVYITPYENSTGPAILVDAFSKGLAASSESEFLETISKMRKSWDTLKFPEIPVIERVRKEGNAIPDLTKIYPGVGLKKTSEWEARNREV